MFRRGASIAEKTFFLEDVFWKTCFGGRRGSLPHLMVQLCCRGLFVGKGGERIRKVRVLISQHTQGGGD